MAVAGSSGPVSDAARQHVRATRGRKVGSIDDKVLDEAPKEMEEESDGGSSEEILLVEDDKGKGDKQVRLASCLPESTLARLEVADIMIEQNTLRCQVEARTTGQYLLKSHPDTLNPSLSDSVYHFPLNLRLVYDRFSRTFYSGPTSPPHQPRCFTSSSTSSFERLHDLTTLYLAVRP